MIGSLKWNMTVASLTAISAFIFSLRVNPPETSLWRSALAFLLLFLLVFVVRFVLTLIHYEDEDGAVGDQNPVAREEERDSSSQKDESNAEKTSELIRELIKEDNQQ